MSYHVLCGIPIEGSKDKYVFIEGHNSPEVLTRASEKKRNMTKYREMVVLACPDNSHGVIDVVNGLNATEMHAPSGSGQWTKDA